MQEKIVIVGGGLSGLTLAYLLKKVNKESIVLEGSNRLGGRIQTIKGNLETPLEIGATWFSDQHPNLLALIEELHLKKFPQFSKGISLFETKSFEPPQRFFVPESEAPSYRLAGGTQLLINTLESTLDPGSIVLDSRVTRVHTSKDKITLDCANGQRFNCDKLVICVPPQLVSNIIFSPELPSALTKVLPTVQTWMAGSIKFVLEYDHAFWRKEGYSGMLFSHAGIVTEMYDHTNFEENKFGFTGFLNGAAVNYSYELRKELVIKQLADLLGGQARKPVSYHDKIWNNVYVQDGPQSIHRPHQNNGHPALQESYMDGSVLFCGTESATVHPGYMEGAVISAKRIFEKL